MSASPPPIAFAGGLFNRESTNRTDPGWVKALRVHKSARFLAVIGDDIAIHGAAPGPDAEVFWIDASVIVNAGLDPARALLLGSDRDISYWAISLSADELARICTDVSLPACAIALRAIAAQAHLAPRELAIAATGKSLVNWHDTHLFCSRCGDRTTLADAGAKRVCPACKAEHFPRVNPVAIMLIHAQDKCVLGRQARFPPGVYSALAGFVEPGESIEEAVRRETFEEAGIEIGTVEYLASQPWPFMSNLMIGCFAEALSDTLNPDLEELEDVRWFPAAELADMLAGSHSQGLTTPAPFAIAHHLIRTFVARHTENLSVDTA